MLEATAGRMPNYSEPITSADMHPSGCVGCKLDNGPHKWTPPTTATSRPPDPGTSDHKPWCITVVGYWRWLLFGWRHRG